MVIIEAPFTVHSAKPAWNRKETNPQDMDLFWGRTILIVPAIPGLDSSDIKGVYTRQRYGIRVPKSDEVSNSYPAQVFLVERHRQLADGEAVQIKVPLFWGPNLWSLAISGPCYQINRDSENCLYDKKGLGTPMLGPLFF